MGAGVAYSDLPEGAKVLDAPGQEYSDLPQGAKVLSGAPQPGFLSTLWSKVKPSQLHAVDPSFNPLTEPAKGEQGSLLEQARGWGKGALDIGRGVLNTAIEGTPGPNLIAPYLESKIPQVPASRSPEEEAGRSMVNYGTTAAGAALGAPDFMEAAAPVAGKILGAPVRAGTRAMAQGLNKTLKPILKLGTPIEDVSSLPDIRLPGENLGLPTRTAPTIYPGAPLPEGPPPEAELGRLPVPQAAPASQTGEALGRLPLKQRMMAPEAAPPPAATPQRLQDLIQQGTGGSPLQPNVPLREQVKSSALQNYSYDAAVREFHIRGNDGTLYTYGDVSPEEAQAFNQAPSKGKAWQAIKQNPLVKKNGKPVIPTGRVPSLTEQIRSSGLPSHGTGAASAEEVARGEKFLRISPSGLREFQGVSPDPTSPLRQNEAIIAVKPDGSWRLQDGNPQIAQDHAQRAIKAYKPAVKLKDLISE